MRITKVKKEEVPCPQCELSGDICEVEESFEDMFICSWCGFNCFAWELRKRYAAKEVEL